MEIPSIVDSVDLTQEFLPVSERYYQHKYCTKFSTQDTNLDQRVSFHSNRICLISLAENHPVIKDNKNIRSLNFKVGKEDRLKNAASGKGKRGAQKLNPDSILCYIECEDDQKFPVYSCVKGKLLEMNEVLITNPNLLVERPNSEGYIALILPDLYRFEETKKSMVSREDYLGLNSAPAVQVEGCTDLPE